MCGTVFGLSAPGHGPMCLLRRLALHRGVCQHLSCTLCEALPWPYELADRCAAQCLACLHLAMAHVLVKKTCFTQRCLPALVLRHSVWLVCTNIMEEGPWSEKAPKWWLHTRNLSRDHGGLGKAPASRKSPTWCFQTGRLSRNQGAWQGTSILEEGPMATKSPQMVLPCKKLMKVLGHPWPPRAHTWCFHTRHWSRN